MNRSAWVSRNALLWLLIERATVQTYQRQAPRRCPVPDEKDWLYRKGDETCFMTIVLSGVLMVLVGRDGFQQEAGAFSVLAVDSLAEQETGEGYHLR